MNKFDKLLVSQNIIEESKTLWTLLGNLYRESPVLIGIYDHKDSALEDAQNYKNSYDSVHVYEGGVNGQVKEIKVVK